MPSQINTARELCPAQNGEDRKLTLACADRVEHGGMQTLTPQELDSVCGGATSNACLHVCLPVRTW